MSPLDKFGTLLMSYFRDRGIMHHLWLEAGDVKAPSLKPLQDALQKMSTDQQQVVRRCVALAIDDCLHDLLVGFQESHDLKKGIEVFADGENVAELSGMLHGEIFGENGWIKRFSKYPPCEDIVQ